MNSQNDESKSEAVEERSDTDPCPVASFVLPEAGRMSLEEVAGEFRQVGEKSDNRDARQIAEWLEELHQVREFMTMVTHALTRIKRAR